jgi:hypothetical protein
MTPPLCGRCSYLVSMGVPASDCPACRRALVRDVAFSPAYRGLPLDRLAAVLIGLAAGAVAVATFGGLASALAAVALAAACAYNLFSRRRLTGLARRRAFRRAHRPGAAAAAAGPSTGESIAAQRRPQPTTRQ